MSDQRGVERRRFLQCMAWTGTGLALVRRGRGALARARSGRAAAQARRPAGCSFAQISDTHIGFKGAANPDAMGTFEAAIARIKALDPRAGLPDPHRRHHPRAEGGRVRHWPARGSRAPASSGRSTCRASTTCSPTAAPST